MRMAFGLAAVVFLWGAGVGAVCSKDVDPSAGDAERTSSSIERPNGVDELVRRFPENFEITFDVSSDIKREQVTWRRVGDVWRLDSVDAKGNSGWLMVEPVNPDEWLFASQATVDCTWSGWNRTGLVSIDCGTGGLSEQVAVLLFSVSSGTIRNDSPAREIAGRQANCYLIEGVTNGEICVDSIRSVPLYLRGTPVVSDRGKIGVEMQARTVELDSIRDALALTDLPALPPEKLTILCGNRLG